MKVQSGVRLWVGCLLSAPLLLLSQAALAETSAPAPAAAPASAASPGVAIAVVDVEEVFQDSTAAKSARAQIEKYQQSFHDEVSKEENALRNKQQELQKQSASLTQEQMARKARDFDNEVAEYRRKAALKNQALDKAYGTAMGQINDAMIEVVRQVAQAHNVNVVLPRTQVMLFDDKMNVTKEVVDGLNKRLANVTVPQPKIDESKDSGSSKKKSR